MFSIFQRHSHWEKGSVFHFFISFHFFHAFVVCYLEFTLSGFPSVEFMTHLLQWDERKCSDLHALEILVIHNDIMLSYYVIVNTRIILKPCWAKRFDLKYIQWLPKYSTWESCIKHEEVWQSFWTTGPFRMSCVGLIRPYQNVSDWFSGSCRFFFTPLLLFCDSWSKQHIKYTLKKKKHLHICLFVLVSCMCSCL